MYAGGKGCEVSAAADWRLTTGARSSARRRFLVLMLMLTRPSPGLCLVSVASYCMLCTSISVEEFESI